MLAPDPSRVIDQLTANFNAQNSITVWVQALQNVNISPVLDPEPSWYTQLEGTIKSSQADALPWLTEFSPQLGAQTSQMIINYATLFQQAAQLVQPILKTIATQQNGTPTADQQKTLQQLFAHLKATSDQNAVTLSSLQKGLDGYVAQVSQNNTTLKTYLDDIINAEGEAAKKIEQVQAQLQALQIKLAQDSTKATNSSISYGTSTFGVIAGMTFGLALSGGVIALGGFAVSILSIGAAVTFEILYSADVKRDLDAIADAMSELSEDQLQLTLLQGLKFNLDTLDQINVQAQEGNNQLTDLWTNTSELLDALLDTLVQPQINVTTIKALTTLNDAAAAWQKLSDFATRVQQVSLQVPAPIQLPQVVVGQNQPVAH
ncbi:HBL/NHE enterotoxin family protein [Deinococcus cellulosilyticus]|uniref:Uncharacterized protein n=1 Tax=Deinococcus cellulosilyticus (strain DSM 18568 / NBRC 106333 / KACC 11606 / 5516J-15) TaxID=1223518 RepID=A0A511MYJ5_DEIC1|nr:HBL/NHE enterotoxin family protein [Deinococcus cellulosilyticus]GEM45665.1 hypothetical protein DC3_13000 [Deinococcus cellulosilyticus NBRC 106333 = KACC 11606]